MSFEEKYNALIKRYHLAITNDSFLGRTKDKWRELYAQDKHLNNVQLSEWDMVFYSFKVYNPCALSLSEGVCMYKQLVKNWIEEGVK